MDDIKKAANNPAPTSGSPSIVPIDMTTPQASATPTAPTPAPAAVPNQAPAPTQNTTPTPAKTVSSSPWDEDVPEVPEEKPKVVGNLMPKKEIVNEPLKVPEDVEEKVGKKVPAENYIKGGAAPIDYSNQSSVPAPTTAPPQTKSPVMPKQSGESVFSLLKGRIGLILIVLVSFFIIAVALTELGLLSVGLEKVYGATGIEKVWGGLSKNSSSALGQSLIEMQKVTSYKTRGKLNLTVDSSAKSDVISPLVNIITGNVNTIAGTTTSTSLDADTTLSSSTLSTSQATIETIETDFTMKAASSASEAEFTINDNGSKINLINKNSDVYVKDSAGSFSGDSALWINYKISKLDSKNIQTDIFKAEKSQGLAASGLRLGNEKINGVRCFKYSIESAEIGNSLSALGITSEMAQSVTGEVWIGIRDKKIHQANLKIIPPITAATRSITTEINFYDFNIKNTFTSINESDIVTVKKSTTPTVTPTMTADQTRKQDVLNILAALKSYKVKMGYYPVSSALMKLNDTTNAIYNALVPTYLSALPQDPKSADGWYYAYKSDGIKCSVSARLENSTDPEGTLSNGVLLYLIYNND